MRAVMRRFLNLNFVLCIALLAATVTLAANAAAPDADAAKSIFLTPKSPTARIVYVCDSSGSMLSMFDSLRGELRKSIDPLTPEQSFNVIFFQEQRFQAVDDNALIPATKDNKRRCLEFLDKMFVKGETNPIPGLDAAFKQNPEVIFLLTDGDFNGPGNEAVVKYCQEKAQAGKVTINTIAFLSKDSKDKPEDMEFVKALQAIAKESGGKCRVVTEDDMGK